MADYYPLIDKAVSGLEKSTGEARRALYDRARAALLAQLRGVTPALNESDITRERLALEEAIRKVEAEAARRSRNDPPPPQRPRPEPPARLEPAPAPEPAPRAEPPRPARMAPAMPPLEAAEGRPAPAAAKPSMTLNAAATRPVAPEPTEEADDDRGGEPGDEDAAPPERQRWAPGGPSLSDKGLKGFRDVVAETETLGGATAQASRNIRATFAATPSPASEYDRMEPRIEPDLSRPVARRPMPRDAERALGREPSIEPGYGRGDRESRRVRDGEPPRPPSARRPEPPAFDEPVDEPSYESEDSHFEPAVAPPEYPTRPPSSLVRQEDVRPRAPAAPRATVREHRPATAKAAKPSDGKWRRTAALVIAGLLVVAVAGLAIWNGPKFLASFRGAPGGGRTTDTAAPADSGGRPKIADRIGSPSSATNPDSGALVAQKVVLYEEDQSDPAGKRYVGSAVWRTDMVSPGAGQPAEMAVRADIEIPEQKMSVRWSLRRNDDKALPASHTVEIMFTLPPDFPHGGISSIPGVLMKQSESNRGVPLAGLAVKVTTNFFLIGLSSVDAEMQRNLQMLKERSWFDIPIVYNDGKRAIIAIEKGTPGERVFSDAFAAWGQ